MIPILKKRTIRQSFLLSGLLINSITRFSFVSVLVIYLNRIHINPGMIGVVTSIFSITMRGLGPIYGIIVDTYKTKLSFSGSLFLCAIGYIGCYYDMFIISVGILGIGFGLFINVVDSVIIQISETKEQGDHILVLRYIFINIGAAIGPILTSLALIIEINLKYIFVLSGITNILMALLFAIFIFPEQSNKNKNILQQLSNIQLLLSDSRFRIFICSIPLIWFLFSLLYTAIPLFIIKISDTKGSTIASMFTVNAVIVIFSAYPLNRWIVNLCKKYNRSYMDGLAIGAFFMGIALLSLYTVNIMKTASVYIFITIFTIGELAFFPMIFLLINQMIDKRELIGSYFGVASFAAGIGCGLSNLIGGHSIELFQSVGLIYFPLLLSIFAFLTSIFYFTVSKIFID
ncbi:MAG: MFS transporter [Desulfobacterales bacterium]|nr:MFS transporter [Desulfobacterales bacterium]